MRADSHLRTDPAQEAPMRRFNVLFLCTGNSARSILAEALLNALGGNHFIAYSAGSHPGGQVQTLAVEIAAELGYDTARLRSKSWDEFAAPDAPAMDFIITVCDSAAGEMCPFWPGHPVTAHWGVPDPVAVQGDEVARRSAFRRAAATLRRRVELLIALPEAKLDGLAAHVSLQAIAEATR